MSTENEHSPSISVIIVTYNSASDIDHCLRDLTSDSSLHEVIVADNFSSDTSATLVSENYPEVILFKNSENLGFSKAVNRAVDRSSGELVVLVNPDCRVTALQLKQLSKEFMDRHVGVVGPAIVHPQGRLSVRSAGYEPSLSGMLIHATGLGRSRLWGHRFRGFHLYPQAERASHTEVDWVSGACFMTPRTLWDRIEGLDERWFMYAEDLNYCHKARELGYQIIHVSNVEVTHVVGASSNSDAGPVWTLWIENLADYYYRMYRPNLLTFVSWKLVVASIFVSRAVAYEFRALRKRDRSMWQRESQKFIAYAFAVARYRPRS